MNIFILLSTAIIILLFIPYRFFLSYCKEVISQLRLLCILIVNQRVVGSNPTGGAELEALQRCVAFFLLFTGHQLY